MRTIFRAVLVALLWIGLFAARAYAHGGIAGPDDLGPPVITSAVLGVGGYWLMLMWPSRRRPAVNDKKRKPMRGGAK
ncbi:MAG: hypothetical protein ACXWNE_01120 [Candidatus Binataceae bacterium]|jgi:hypothetical protein